MSKTKVKKKSSFFSRFIYTIAWMVLFVCLYFIGIEVYNYIRTISTNDDLQNLYHNQNITANQGVVEQLATNDEANQSAGILPEFVTLLEENPETVGWLTIGNTNIDLPVVQKTDSNIGNSYYLEHDFFGNENPAGTVFIDRRNVLTEFERSDNIVIHGHDQYDGTMFGQLDKYKDLEFYKENPVIDFSTLYAHEEYKIIGYFVSDTDKANGEIFNYYNVLNFADETDFNAYIDEVKARSYMHNDVDVAYGDDLITISTCSTEFSSSRFVVVARKVRPGESSEVNIDNVVKNDDIKRDAIWNELYG